jgi:phosphatidylserine/phosphatidylglycerophosphate/cardiolipin synthase-like enzyme
MIIDASTIITGSFNFTTSAELHNAENLLIIRDSDLALTYMRNWEVHFKHSDPYAGRGTR